MADDIHQARYTFLCSTEARANWPGFIVRSIKTGQVSGEKATSTGERVPASLRQHQRLMASTDSSVQRAPPNSTRYRSTLLVPS